MFSKRDKKTISESLKSRRSDQFAITSVQFRTRGEKEYITVKWNAFRTCREFDWSRAIKTLIRLEFMNGPWSPRLTSGGGWHAGEGSATFRLYPYKIEEY